MAYSSSLVGDGRQFSLAGRRRAWWRSALLLCGLLLATGVITTTRADALPASFYADDSRRAHGGLALIGDSLTHEAWSDLPGRFEEQQWGPFQLEARSARFTVTATETATSGLDAVRRLKGGGFDPRIWIIALGTNDAGLTYGVPGAADELIDSMMAEIGPGHRVVWVNLYKRNSPAATDAFNAALEQATTRYPSLAIADWYSVVAANTQWLADDGVHMNIGGALERNRFVAAAALAFAATELACDPAPIGARRLAASSVHGAAAATAATAATVHIIRLCHR